ncbi:mitochondrial carrier domain-containing protein [Cokeromyces recurvatus]|uniref:mitochondrial carrier domain-containing protein n=1 Tax=Cokeromyces recurvatus TaxID=90255 RepID=UPI00221E549D|nr:mitochondrial carrier domain-containing protein [Cokeromyces recurvatus]KAI7898683.1 mitochondrial carrier domain-containing protein [Cokeromyces recurvatus]
MSNITETSSTEKLISACGGALITSLMVTPMDVVKMRMQTQNIYNAVCCMAFNNCIKQGLQINRITRGQPMLYDCAISITNTATNSRTSPVFKNTFDGLYKIMKYEGPMALWKGLSPALVMSVPSNVIYFVGYDYLKDIIQPAMAISSSTDYSPLVAGAFARTIAVTIISPIELFRTRLQAATAVHDFKHVMEGVKKMVLQDGLQALWRGLPPTLWRDVPFSAIYWMGYEQIKYQLEDYYSLGELQVSFISGALSGMFAATITTPFDVAKTRRQVDAGREKPLLKDSRVPGILKQIYRQEGIRGLFSGLTPRVAKIGPSCAIMISSYVMGKTFFSSRKLSF